MLVAVVDKIRVALREHYRRPGWRHFDRFQRSGSLERSPRANRSAHAPLRAHRNSCPLTEVGVVSVKDAGARSELFGWLVHRLQSALSGPWLAARPAS